MTNTDNTRVSESFDRRIPTEAGTLRTALRVNGAFSTITGLIAAIDAGPITELIGIEQTWLVRLTGIGLLIFAIALFLIAGQRDAFVQSKAALISAADIGWVIGSAVIIATGWLSTAGMILLALLAIPVLTLAVVQLRARAAL